MMRPTVNALLVAAVLTTGSVAMMRIVVAVRATATGQAPAVSVPLGVARSGRDSISALVALAGTRSPFRFIDPEPVATSEEPLTPLSSTVAPTPTFLLKAIVGGPPWQAVIQGVPGSEGDRVVRQGERVADLTVLAIAREAVVIRWIDSTWTMRLDPRQP